MKTLNNYISDNLFLESESGKETRNNAERKKELENWLKGKDYETYVEVLNKMLEDPKAKALLMDGFGGELGDTKLKCKKRKLLVKTLKPCQREIDISKSIDYPLKKPENIDNYYSKGPDSVMIVGMPLITFRKNFIIDGHHRWSQVYAFNPEAEMVVFDYDGPISSDQMLKAVQGAIAAVKADTSNDNDGKLPSEDVQGLNLFDKKWQKEDIIEYIKKNAVSSVVDTFKKYHKELNDMDKVANYVAENLMLLKANNTPENGDNAPSRGDMPQTDKGGSDSDNSKTSLPDKEGSALNRLATKEFVKGAVQ
jgi:hypothetical protein